jgi:hypothetical protein
MTVMSQRRCLQGQGVVAHALHDIGIGVRSARKGQLVVVNVGGALADILHNPLDRVDFGDLRHANVAALKHLPIGRDHVSRQDGCTPQLPATRG